MCKYVNTKSTNQIEKYKERKNKQAKNVKGTKPVRRSWEQNKKHHIIKIPFDDNRR